MRGASLEITPNNAQKLESFALLPRGTTVNITYLPGTSAGETIHVAKRLVADGMVAVPHVPARSFADLAAVERYLAELAAAGVTEVLCIGGGVATPVGQLAETRQILESGLLEKVGIRRVGLAAHPEGSPDIPSDALSAAMRQKHEWAQAALASGRLEQCYWATQFCFEAQPVLQWEQQLRKEVGNTLPIRIGVPGPAKMTALVKFAAASGVQASAKFLVKNPMKMFGLVSQANPSQFVRDVSAAMAEGDRLFEGFHWYPFGGFQRTARYVQAVQAGNFVMKDDGFDVEE